MDRYQGSWPPIRVSQGWRVRLGSLRPPGKCLVVVLTSLKKHIKPTSMYLNVIFWRATIKQPPLPANWLISHAPPCSPAAAWLPSVCRVGNVWELVWGAPAPVISSNKDGETVLVRQQHHNTKQSADYTRPLSYALSVVRVFISYSAGLHPPLSWPPSWVSSSLSSGQQTIVPFIKPTCFHWNYPERSRHVGGRIYCDYLELLRGGAVCWRTHLQPLFSV